MKTQNGLARPSVGFFLFGSFSWEGWEGCFLLCFITTTTASITAPLLNLVMACIKVCALVCVCLSGYLVKKKVYRITSTTAEWSFARQWYLSFPISFASQPDQVRIGKRVKWLRKIRRCTRFVVVFFVMECMDVLCVYI